jgi:virulence factor Mce-like protein
MRRGLVGFAVAGAILAIALLATRGGGGDSSPYRVAVLFDTAKGMVAGQQVKIAGAPAGTVKEVDLAPGPQARMILEVQRRFAPFHADARCSILPEGLISENYVDCDPGAARRTLGDDGSGTPTVRVAHTAVPVSLQDVLNVFSMPTDERLRVLITQLGLGTAGRGRDLNALLRRANPALASSRKVLEVFADQRTQIAEAISQTDRVLARVAAQRRGVRTFVDRAAATARTTAAKRPELAAAINRLPAMLDATRPALRSLDRAAANASPLLDSLDRAAPELARTMRKLPAFTRAARPALRSLGQVTRKNRPVLRRARPTASRLARASSQLAPLATQVDDLLVSLRKTGGIEGTMRIVYTLAALTSTYDDTSHVINFIANLAPNCLIAEQLEKDSPGCAHKPSAPGYGTLPINEPSCGPQKPEHLWRNHRCPIAVPVGTSPDLGLGQNPPPRKRTPKPADDRSPATRPPSSKPPAERPASGPLGIDIPGLLDKLLDPDRQKPPAAGNVKSLLDYLLKP